jgi:hypothetical protein
MRFLASTVVLLCVLGAGLVGGFVAGRQGGSPAVESALGHEHGAHAPVLSERTLANLGVELGEAALSDFVRTVEVPARVEALPGSRRALTTPVAGVVRAVNARVDERVESGGVVAEVVRDAWPQPTLVLTEAIIKPLNEDHHEAAVGVRGCPTSPRPRRACCATPSTRSGARGSSSRTRCTRPSATA